MQEPHSDRGPLCFNWRPLPAAPSPRPPEPREVPLSDEHIKRLEREMEDYYSRPKTEPCFCGRFVLRPGSTLTDSKTWASHRWDRCELKRQPPNATDAEWAEVLCARAVPRRGGMQETPTASPEGPPDPAPAAASAGLAEGVTELTAALFGSSLLPSEVWNGCAFLQLGAVVRCAFSASGLTVAEWNALPPLDREARLAHAVYWMRGLVPTCAAAPDKASDRAASAGKSGSPGQENGAPAKAWLVRLTCCGRDNGKYETATRAEADAFRNDYLNAPGHVRSAIIEAAAPLPEKQSESRAASAGLDDALYADSFFRAATELLPVVAGSLTANTKCAALAAALGRVYAEGWNTCLAEHPGRAASAGEGALRLAMVDVAARFERYAVRCKNGGDHIRSGVWAEAADMIRAFGSDAIGAALAPAQRERK